MPRAFRHIGKRNRNIKLGRLPPVITKGLGTKLTYRRYLTSNSRQFLVTSFQISQSSMKAVSPLEEFDVSLGVDPAVKITYKPTKKFKQSTGILSKYQQLQYHQEIVIKNTKSTPVKITITDQVPKTSEEKVKVCTRGAFEYWAMRGLALQEFLSSPNSNFLTGF